MRSLFPREHGAYVQLLVPLVVALASGRPTMTAVLFAVAACAAFLAYEPLLVLRGHRGRRMQTAHGAIARRRLAGLVGAASVSGTLALVWASPAATRCALALFAPALVLVALVWTKHAHSLAGELVAAIVLTGAATPVAVASGVDARDALVLWAAWAYGFACSVIAVHRVIDRHKRAVQRIDRIYAAALVGAALVVLAIPWRPFVAIALPIAAASAVVAVSRIPATRLRTIGIAMSIVSLLSGACLLALRAS